MRVIRNSVLRPWPQPAASTCANEFRAFVALPMASLLKVLSRLNFFAQRAAARQNDSPSGTLAAQLGRNGTAGSSVLSPYMAVF
ncbi:hypothetical protein N5A92_26070 [Chelativorans sp. EGI FJ00035]|uniref:Uncharacterized protein n=1 Tax=Chelativorans salis TaxID=2978478 RepID=A0ABT2LVC2_9HYPH|nr:hypothetical protein [Chelativorans sp. EGI FJ00035]